MRSESAPCPISTRNSSHCISPGWCDTMAAPTICPMRMSLALAEAGAERLLRQHDVLHVAEELEAPVAAFAADARALDAAEGRGQVADAAQAVVGAVGERDGLVVAVEGLQREHRAEDLVLHDLAVLRDVREQGR